VTQKRTKVKEVLQENRERAQEGIKILSTKGSKRLVGQEYGQVGLHRVK
jgi:hypothetical protein